MKHPVVLAFACAVAATVAAPSPGEARSTQCAAVSDAIIDAQYRAFSDSWATGDAGKVAELFAPDAVLLATVSNTPRTTPAGIRDYFEHFLAGKPVAHLDTSTIRLGCNTAAKFGTWTIDLTDAAAGQQSEVHARYTFVYKFDHGQWRIDHLHSSRMPEAQAGH